jgi:hypothetical protein
MWEEARGLDGAALFRARAAVLAPGGEPDAGEPAAAAVKAPVLDVRLSAAEAEVDAQTARARQAESRLAAARAELEQARAAVRTTERERDLIASSARHFLRRYWPALRREMRRRLPRR